jgi:hypothetical protein
LKEALTVDVNPDTLTWSYGLNTKNYPTFGGEVVQILSMFIEDMTITGTVSSYEKIEKIYSWFIAYMQRATQGKSQAYDTTPVTFEYPARGWKFLIQPKTAPQFKYGRDVVAPTWSVTAAVVESPESFESTLQSAVEAQAMQNEEFQPFGTATAQIGFSEFNPWTTPNTGKAYKEGATRKYYEELSGANGPFNSFIKTLLEDEAGIAEALGANYSKAAFNDTGGGTVLGGGNTRRPDGSTPPTT